MFKPRRKVGAKKTTGEGNLSKRLRTFPLNFVSRSDKKYVQILSELFS